MSSDKKSEEEEFARPMDRKTIPVAPSKTDDNVRISFNQSTKIYVKLFSVWSCWFREPESKAARMTLIAGMISKNKVTVMSDIGITSSDKSKYDYTTSLLAGESLSDDSSFIEEMCHKVITLGSNAILAFSGSVVPALDRIRLIKACYDNDNPERSIRWILDKDSTDKYSFIVGVRNPGSDFKLFGFNVDKVKGISYSNNLMFSGSGTDDKTFIADAKDLIEIHYGLDTEIRVPLLMAGLTDLGLAHNLKEKWVSGPMIACTLDGPSSVNWNSSYSIVYYDGATMRISRCFSVYVADGIARYFSTATSAGNQRNWILSADGLVTKGLPLEKVAHNIDAWDKEHRKKYDEQLDTFSGAPILFIDERTGGPKKVTFVAPKAKSRSLIKISPDKIVNGAQVASGYDIVMTEEFALGLATPSPNVASKTGIIVSR